MVDQLGLTNTLQKSIFRAIEQNSFLIRSANKGISAIINNKGEIVKKLDLNETGNIELEVPLIENKNKNKNDLIFFSLLITYILIFIFNKKIMEKKINIYLQVSQYLKDILIKFVIGSLIWW